MTIAQLTRPTITQLTRLTFGISNSQQFNNLPPTTKKSDKKQLAAQWLLHKNSQLYCKWAT